jgi:probable addiction module antidote protein
MTHRDKKFHRKGEGMVKRTYAKHVAPVEARKELPEVVASLNSALEKQKGTTAEAFLLALRQVSEAFGIAQLAEEAKLSRESLYRTLSAKGNPRLSTVVALLDVLGLQLKVAQRTAAKVEHSQPIVEHSHKTPSFPSRSLPPPPPTKSKVLKVTLWLRVERNSKFVRGKTRAREDIEYYVLGHYDMKKRWADGSEYELTIPYDTDEELDDIIYRDILQAASLQADMHNCFIETDMRALNGSERSW